MEKKIKEYSNFKNMINDITLVDGDICKTLGYDIELDCGDGVWIVKQADNADNLTSFNINNTSLMVEYYLEKKAWINLKALGLKPDNNSDTIKNFNSNLLKGLINKYKKNVNYYIPFGTYYFNEINIDDTGYYEINLYGENGGVSDSSYRNSGNVIICTPGCGFINRITKSRDNQTKFNVYNIRFIQAILYDKLPVGKCLGVNYNGGSEYNCYLQNVYIHGYEYGFYSPGYSCGGTGGKKVAFSHCKYGIYIEGASHGFNLDSVDLLYCKYGIRMSVGGNPCRISNVHVAVGCFQGMDGYMINDNKMYAIHSKGGLVIDGIYYEQYSGELDVSNYTLIDYEGWGNGNVGKLIIKNTPIGNMGAGNKGYFFKGATFIGAGEETGVVGTRIYKINRNNYFGNGCVEFINCIGTGSIELIKRKIKKAFYIDNGLDNAFGFTFDNIDIFGDGLTFIRNYRRRFNSYLSGGNFNTNTLINRYDTNSIPLNNRVWSGIEFPMTPITDNDENLKGTQYIGNIIINNIENKDINLTIGIIGKVNGNYIMIRELVKLDSNSVNKYIKIEVDEYISLLEASDIFFGYRCDGIGDKSERISKEDEQRIIYDIEASYDTLNMYSI